MCLCLLPSPVRALRSTTTQLPRMRHLPSRLPLSERIEQQCSGTPRDNPSGVQYLDAIEHVTDHTGTAAMCDADEQRMRFVVLLCTKLLSPTARFVNVFKLRCQTMR